MTNTVTPRYITFGKYAEIDLGGTMFASVDVELDEHVLVAVWDTPYISPLGEYLVPSTVSAADLVVEIDADWNGDATTLLELAGRIVRAIRAAVGEQP